MDVKATVLITILLIQITSSSTTITDQDYNLMPPLFEFDDYDKCLYRSNDVEAMYCLVTVKLLPKYLNKSSVAWNIIEEVSSVRTNYRHDLLRHGVCTSGKCQKFNETKRQCLNRIYNAEYEHLGLSNQIDELRCERKYSDRIVDIKDLVVMTVLGLYVVFVVLASAWTTLLRNKSCKTDNEKETSYKEDIISAFSLTDNISSILNINAQNETKTCIHFVQGLRFFVSLFVLIVHSILPNLCTAVSDPKKLEEITSQFFGLSLLLLTSRSALLTFCVISSWLMTINFFEKLERSNHVNLGEISRIIIKRYIRFTSGHVVIIALHTSVLKRMFRGPFWEQEMGCEHQRCSEKWWKNLLYINNFFPGDTMCLVHTWYLAVDFQLIVLGLLILWLTQKKPKLLFMVSGLLVFLQIVYTSFNMWFNNFGYVIQLTPESLYDMKFAFTKEFQSNWMTPFSYLSGLAIGLCLGYLYTQHKDKRRPTNKNNDQTLWWVSTLTLTIGTIFLSAYYRTTSYYSSNRWLTATYGGIEKTLCFFGIALFLFGLSEGRGGFVKKVLEWSPIRTLGGLSFGVYLIQITFLMIDAGLKRTPSFTSYYFMATDTMKFVLLSYLGSIMLTAFVLMPVEKLCRKIL